YDWRQRPRHVVAEFRAEVADLSANTRTKLAEIIGEEQSRVPRTDPGADFAPEFTRQEIEQAIEAARACYARIAERARPVLDAQQNAAFARFQERKLAE